MDLASSHFFLFLLHHKSYFCIVLFHALRRTRCLRVLPWHGRKRANMLLLEKSLQRSAPHEQREQYDLTFQLDLMIVSVIVLQTGVLVLEPCPCIDVQQRILLLLLLISDTFCCEGHCARECFLRDLPRLDFTLIHIIRTIWHGRKMSRMWLLPRNRTMGSILQRWMGANKLPLAVPGALQWDMQPRNFYAASNYVISNFHLLIIFYQICFQTVSDQKFNNHHEIQ